MSFFGTDVDSSTARIGHLAHPFTVEAIMTPISQMARRGGQRVGYMKNISRHFRDLLRGLLMSWDFFPFDSQVDFPSSNQLLFWGEGGG